jgi:MFS family permease
VTAPRWAGAAFASLAVPNFRRYLSGQALSLVGTWMQMTAQSWLVLTLTHSATLVGIQIAVQTLPVLLLAPVGGVLADRLNKRTFMMTLQSIMGVQALILGVLTAAHLVTFWEVLALGLVLGANNAFENPARQSMMLELAGADRVRNAVSLYATSINLAKVTGPAIAGVLVSTVGTGYCFLINAASFIPVLLSLARIDESALYGRPLRTASRKQAGLRAGLRYAARTPGLGIPLAVMFVIGCLAFEWQVSLPYLADQGLHAGAVGYGFLNAAMSVGSVGAGLALAARGGTGTGRLLIAAAATGVTMTLAALAPDLTVELIVMVGVGAATVYVMSGGNATLQLGASPEMRGRVMALWTVCFQGSTPVGGPIVGAVMSAAGARAGLALGAAASLAAALGGAIALRAVRKRQAGAGESAPGESATAPAGG